MKAQSSGSNRYFCILFSLFILRISLSLYNFHFELQGSDLQVEEPPPVRSPLTEKIGYDPFPKSPLSHKYNADPLLSSHVLPPLKFHPGLLPPLSLVTPCLDHDEDESVASVPDDEDTNYSDEEVDFLDKPTLQSCAEEEIFGYTYNSTTRFSRTHGSSLNTAGMSKEKLKIEVPENFRRYTTDGELGNRRYAPSGGGSDLHKRVLRFNLHVGLDLLLKTVLTKECFFLIVIYVCDGFRVLQLMIVCKIQQTWELQVHLPWLLISDKKRIALRLTVNSGVLKI
jgi:hypothetical protein